MDYTYLDCLAKFGVGGAHPGGLSLTKNLLAREDINHTTKILDVGCGTGQTSAYMAKRYGCSIIAMDSNPLMIENAKKRFQSLQLPIKVEEGNAEHLPFQTGVFDMVVSESVLAFTEVLLAIPEVKRVLKPNGVILAIEMVLEQPISDEEKRPILDFYGIPQLLTELEWCDYFQKAGFKQIINEKENVLMENQEGQLDTDFSISEDIDEKYYDILDQHEKISKEYKGLIGARIFRCSC